VHLDIKLENILLDKYWNVKVSDFGLALNGYIQNIKHGTPMYYPPEFFTPIHTYDGRKVDIFSAGIVLFILLMGYQPWTRLDDEFYYCIRYQDFDRFWELHAVYGRVISINAKSLLNRMFEEADSRITIEGIKKSYWFTTPNRKINYTPISNEDMVQRFDEYESYSKEGKRRTKRRNVRNGRKSKGRKTQDRKSKGKLKIPKLIRN
jgi:serine/threonine protein kinase